MPINLRGNGGRINILSRNSGVPAPTTVTDLEDQNTSFLAHIGVSYGSNTMSISNVASPTTAGCSSWNYPSDYFNGYIDDVRISKGLAQYTGNFTPPVAQLGIADPTKFPSSPHEGQVVFADAGKTIAYVCTNATGPVWTRFAS